MLSLSSPSLRLRRTVGTAQRVSFTSHVLRLIPSSGKTPGVQTVASKHVVAEQVHKWFASLAADDHPVEDILSSNARLIDNMNQVITHGILYREHTDCHSS